MTEKHKATQAYYHETMMQEKRMQVPAGGRQTSRSIGCEVTLPSIWRQRQLPHSDGRSPGASGLTMVTEDPGGAKSARPWTSPSTVWSMFQPMTTMSLPWRVCTAHQVIDVVELTGVHAVVAMPTGVQHAELCLLCIQCGVSVPVSQTRVAA